METFSLIKFELIILISVICFVGIRADSFSVLDALFEGISVRLDNMEQSFENRLDNVMNDVNKRLERLENKVGIGGSNSDINGQAVETGPETAGIILDIKETKRSLLKAMSIEKQILRESMHEYEDKWNGFKESVVLALGEMNSTLKKSNQNLTKKMEHNTELQIQRITSKTSKEFVTVGKRIDNIDDNVAALNIKQGDHAGIVKDIESRINDLNRITESTEASLNYVTKRVDKLSKSKHGFSAYLSSTTTYNEGDIIICDATRYNTGYYDASTGIFTVPEAGQYLFSISAEGSSGKKVLPQIKYIKDQRVFYGPSVYVEKGLDVTASITFIYYLEEGNEIWLYSYQDDCEYYQHRTSFTGVLLDR
ncbi:hypothetical protein ACF0H5_010401 [Mactra antiquata]